jgi:hypothetical protein
LWYSRDTAQNFRGRTQENHGHLSHDSRCPGQDSKRNLPEIGLERYRYTNLVWCWLHIFSILILYVVRNDRLVLTHPCPVPITAGNCQTTGT